MFSGSKYQFKMMSFMKPLWNKTENFFSACFDIVNKKRNIPFSAANKQKRENILQIKGFNLDFSTSQGVDKMKEFWKVKNVYYLSAVLNERLEEISIPCWK